MSWRAPAGLSAALIFAAACFAPAKPEPVGIARLDPPAAAGAMGPNVTADGDGVILTWLEPQGSGHALRFARMEDGMWSQPRTVVGGKEFFANWADFPSIARAAGGPLVAHWLQKSGPGTYAYDVQLARSLDGGAAWAELGAAHDDGVAAEHGFVSMLPEALGVRAFWLDGREMGEAGGDQGGSARAERGGHEGEDDHDGAAGHGESGAMTLRTALVTEKVGPSDLLDSRVCECCQTSAAVTADGPLVVYRDRSNAEIRDIWVVRRDAHGWTRPAPVHQDGWEVPGCPVNGPAVAAEGRRVAVAWFTAANDQPHVQVAFSEDSGSTFSRPAIVDTAQPLGRVGVVLDDGGDAIVIWLGDDEGESAEILLRRVSPDGRAGEPLRVSRTTRSRASGFPRIARDGEELLIAWTETGEISHVRAAKVAAMAVPAADVRKEAASGSHRAARSTARSWDRRPGSATPAYTARALDGRPVSLSELRGEAVLVNLWATWCAPCRAEVPELIALHLRHAAQGLRVVGVSLDEAVSQDLVRRFVQQERIPYTVLHDPEDRASALFGVSMLPGSFLFDRQGVLVWSRQGVIGRDDPDLAEALRKALARDPA